MPGKLESKVAIITGGASGIGLAAVRRYVEEGAKVVIADVADDLGNKAAEELGENTIFVHTDVTSEHGVENVVAQAVNAFGKLDIFYNNAGIGGSPHSTWDIEPADLDQVVAVNVRSVALGHKYAARQFKAQGGGGTIVTTVSTGGLQGGWGPSAYVVSKHAVVGIIRQAVVDFVGSGIRTNGIAPGIIMTPLFAKTFGVPLDQSDEFVAYLADRLASTQPIGRVGQPTDVANAAVFLGSDESSFMTGAVVPVDGGATAITQSTFPTEVLQAATDFNTQRATKA
jgi:NAD(P)-dependent dehydrogenase (short-subunit alcohol dehydrogenase family)